MKKLALLILVFLTLFTVSLLAQNAMPTDSLPKFSVKNVGGNRIILAWTNPFKEIKQISIQRSFDSLKNFKTVLTVADPTTPQNGYVDTKAFNDHMFYRLYILLDQGMYLFSESKRPVLDTAKTVAIVLPSGDTTYVPANVRLQKPGSNTTPFLTIAPDSTQIGPITDNRPKAERWTASKFVYTVREGGVSVSLPAGEDKDYSIKFFTIDDEPLFELKDLKERTFKVDKASFFKSGWFKFELYEDGKLMEKNKFFISREF